MTRYQQASMSIFIRNIEEDSLSKNKLAFLQIDTDNSGQLDQDEMESEITLLNEILPDLNFTEEDVHNTFLKLDADKTGLITYSQFIIATLDPEIMNDETLLRYNFNDLDSLKEGFLTRQSLVIAFQRKGYEIND